MPEFNIGDRVKRIDFGGGYGEQMDVGDLGTVIEGLDIWDQCIRVRTDRGREVALKPIRFELVERAPPRVPMIEVPMYVVFYRWHGEIMHNSFTTERRLEEYKRAMNHVGDYEILATKKLKVKVPENVR